MRLDLGLFVVDLAHVLPIAAIYVLGCFAFVVVLNWMADRDLHRSLDEDAEVEMLERWLEAS